MSSTYLFVFLRCYALVMCLIPRLSDASEYAELIFVKLLVWQHLAEALGCRQGPLMGQSFPNNYRYRFSIGTVRHTLFPQVVGYTRNRLDQVVNCCFFLFGLSFLLCHLDLRGLEGVRAPDSRLS